MFATMLTIHILLLLLLFRMFASGQGKILKQTILITTLPLLTIKQIKQVDLYYLLLVGLITSAIAAHQNCFKVLYDGVMALFL